MNVSECRLCKKKTNPKVDFGSFPFPNELKTLSLTPTTHYPLILSQCETCGLNQIPHYTRDVFGNDYPYESKISFGYVSQCEQLVNECIQRFSLTPESRILEIGCNDGYLLQHFAKQGYKNLVGVDPISRLCEKAREYAYVQAAFFDSALGASLSQSHGPFDLIIANNVIAHVPDLFDFMQGLRNAARENTKCIIEVHDFDHLLKHQQWDTIYHEHYSYYTADTLKYAMQAGGFHAIEVKNIQSHGGSLRGYFNFQSQLDTIQVTPRDLTSFARDYAQSTLYLSYALRYHSINRKKVIAFGAAAKGVQFLNALGMDKNLIPACIDETPFKQGKIMPGCEVPIVPLSYLEAHKPDLILILAWNAAEECKRKLAPFKIPCITKRMGALNYV